MKPVSLQFFLNHYLEPIEVAKQTRDMHKAGFQAVAGHARAGMLTPYMSEGWWDAVDAILTECQKSGMHYCIWDEDYFPSGHAGGRVVWSNPSLIAGSLEFFVKNFSGEGPFEFDFDSGQFLGAWAIDAECSIIDISAFCGTRRQNWTHRYINHGAYSPQINHVGNPHWRCAFNTNKHAALWCPDTPGDYKIVGAVVKPTPNSAPDIMNPEAVKKFIEYSYEPYYARYPKLFGNVIDSAFTDEPSPGGMTYPWTPQFLEQFKIEHKYDLTPYLVHLAVEIDQTTPTIRHHYRQTQHRLLVSAYVKQLADWCTEHNIEFTGHLTRTEWISLTSVYWPNELRTYKEMHVPCCDPLGTACALPGASSYSVGVKVVSSAAHLFGKEQAGSDALAVIGDEAKLRDMKFMLDFQMVMGANAFMLHGASYSLDGPRKDEVPPSLSYHHSEWKHFNILNNYISDTCDKLTGGTHICKTLVLYPSASLYCQADPSFNWYHLSDEPKFHQFIELLLSKQKDFDFIDETTLTELPFTKDKLQTAETYNHLILPFIRYIDADSADALSKCAEYGLKVIVLGYIPSILPKNPEEMPVQINIEGMEFVEENDTGFIKSLYGVKVEGNEPENIFVLERVKNEKPVTFVLNRSESCFEGTIDDVEVNIPAKGSIFLQSFDDSTFRPKQLANYTTGDWQCSFDINTVPLNFWHVIEREDMLNQTYPTPPPCFNLMEREIDTTLSRDGHFIYTCRFYITGDLYNAILIMDNSAITGDWQLFVNDILITDWYKGGRFDCLDCEAQIGHALIRGNVPTLNHVRIESKGVDHGLHEVLFLLGDFECEYRYAHLSSPYLTASSNTKQISDLQDWACIGYPTYSGTAVYETSLSVRETGNYYLDLGRVEDIAAVYIDDEKIGEYAWQPYASSIGNLSQGNHILRVEITNTLGNRTRAAHLPAGLLGPIRLYKTD